MEEDEVDTIVRQEFKIVASTYYQQLKRDVKRKLLQNESYSEECSITSIKPSNGLLIFREDGTNQEDTVYIFYESTFKDHYREELWIMYLICDMWCHTEYSETQTFYFCRLKVLQFPLKK